MHFLVFPSLSAKAFILKLDLITSLALIILMRKKTIIANVTGYTSSGFGLSSSLSNATSSFYLGFRALLSK